MLRVPFLLVAVCCLLCAGCHDGPLYALKHANPYFVRQWKQDEALGTTDYQRKQELELLVRTVPSMTPAERSSWLVHLEKIVDNDPSPDMRHLALRAAESIEGAAALELVEGRLDDDSLKVRMAACDILGKRPEPEAATVLARVAGESTNLDIRQAALRALGGHGGPVAKDSLKLALQDRDPAIRLAAMQSLQQVTGQTDLGTSDPQAWVAYLEGQTDTAGSSRSLGQRMRDLF